tara:strand:+ start:76 stop:255 length:180 start_codon:yes stop_codon:yes gene_type:complete
MYLIINIKLITFSLVSGADNIILDTNTYWKFIDFASINVIGEGVLSPSDFLQYLEELET